MSVRRVTCSAGNSAHVNLAAIMLRANRVRIVEHKEPWPEVVSQPCPECKNQGELIGVTVYSNKSGRPSMEHFYCDDCGLEFTVENPS